ncbi:MAG TPA: class I SAM-dependent methyltransferase [Spirochaetota bacterium]|nr:class I SAM-dependent methyltransferase [Spirochaetota bacterium]HPJ34595.1 class I SAM-dependent methyltransferase [Spirochaetota bacterium]
MSRKKLFHPEGIPWPFSDIYNLVSLMSVFQEHYKLVAEEISLTRKSGTLLDIGAGPGWLLIAFKRAKNGFSMTGVDISRGMIRRAERNIARAGYADEIRVTAGRAHSLPFDDDSFDVIVSTGSIHHWSEPEASMKEIRRVLKKEGEAWIYDLVKKIPPDIFAEIKKRYGSFRAALLWLHSFEEPFYDIEEFESLVPGSGLVHVDTHFTGALCSLHLKKE